MMGTFICSALNVTGDVLGADT